MHVLISGAGIAGSCLAWFLLRLDIKVTVLERSKAQLGQGQNIDLSSGAIKVAKRMGLLEEIRKYNTTEKGTIFLDRAGKQLASFPVNPKGPSPTAEFEILRGDLATIFYNTIKDHPNVEFRFETSVEELIANEDAVKVKLSDGKQYDYDMAFAADGQWSKLRKLAFPSEAVTIVDKGAYCAYWTIPRQADDTEWWYVYCALESRVCSLRPDPHGTMRACLTKMPLSEAERQEWNDVIRGSKAAQKDMVEKCFGTAGWQTRRFLDAMKDAPDFYLQALQQVKMDKWWTNRVVCLGDAAHAPTPLTGMGTTLAIMGAYILAGELSKLQPGDAPSKAFEAYDKTFHKHTDKIQNIPSFVPGIAHPSSKWHLWALEAGAFVASKVLQVPFIAKAFGGRGEEDNDGGFPLPEYATLDAKLGAVK